MLELSSCNFIDRVKITDYKIEKGSQALCRLLQALPNLQDLKLFNMQELDDSVLTTVSRMQYLQSLNFQAGASFSRQGTEPNQVALSVLPTSLTALSLSAHDILCSFGGADSLQLVLGSSPDLGQHTRLQELQLTWVTMEVAALRELPRLRQLRLRDCGLMINPDDHLDDASESDDEEAVAVEELAQCRMARIEALLAALGHLTQLQELQLHGMGLERLTDSQHATGLTASSQLTFLKVCNYLFGQPVLPNQALLHMLPPGMQLRNLKRMELEGYRSMLHNRANVTGEDIAHIAAACPALDPLHLVHVLADSAAVAALSLLGGLAPGKPTLTALDVAGAACNDSLSLSAAAVVAQLTGLRSLAWDDSPEQLSGLQLLTALPCLTELKLPQWQRSGRPLILQTKVSVEGKGLVQRCMQG
jgi:hypothetical protein